MAKKKIGVLTGGGDAPGLNAVIYALVRACAKDYDLVGYRFGYRGLYNNDFIPLTVESTSGILHRGGTILYSSNKDNLFDYAEEENGVIVKRDRSDKAVANMKEQGVEALVVLGGDGTLTSARDFARKGVNVIGVPKTIDNDLLSTDTTFGFDTAVNIVVENLGRLHTTAESHHRVMVVEVMGRSAGWIALHSGIAGSADVILIPEIPYTVDRIADKIKAREEAGKRFSIIVITEGASAAGEKASVGKIVEDSPDSERFGGIAKQLELKLEKLITNEVRSCSLGHIQRGGDTSPADRLLSVRYGVKAAELIKNGEFGKNGRMVCLKNGRMDSVCLLEAVGDTPVGSVAKGLSKRVDPNCELVQVARSLGISFGD